MQVIAKEFGQFVRSISLRKSMSELLGKRFMDPVIPFIFLVLIIGVISVFTPSYLSVGNLQSLAYQFSEFGFIALAMALVVMIGGIDLSVGSVFALSNFFALVLFNVVGLPVGLVIPATLLFGAFLGSINGFIIGILKARAFLVTLVTMIIFRAIFLLSAEHFAMRMAISFNYSDAWDFIGGGRILGIPFNALVLVAVCIIIWVLLTRSRLGWHLLAIGGARRSARNAGIPIQRMVFSTYVLSSVLCSLAGLLYAARQNSSGSDTGQSFEVLALTAVVLGGVAMSGGRGSVGRAMIGAAIIMVLTNGLVRNGASGEMSSLVLGAVLLIAVGVDVKWTKHKERAIEKIYVSPAFYQLPECPSVTADAGSAYQINDRAQNAEALGLGKLDGPEDIIFDRQNRMYAGTRDGLIVRLYGDNYEHIETFARTGGRPLGMAFDKDDNLVVCVAGMGLYMVTPDREVKKLTDETNRTWYSINDDSRLRLADDLDIAPDGKIYFSEATKRYEMEEWPLDGIECRGSGRIICYDPATDRTRTVINNLIFPNGVCVSHDNKSILFAQTWSCKLSRYWLEGPKAGKVETVIPNLPGYPDNINRSSDGKYWLALVGMRNPAYDMALSDPGFRTRMVKRIPPDEWLCPNLNNGGALKITDSGEVQETIWDPGAKSHAMITSMREHKGYLYLGGVTNNRVGRIPLPDADPNWSSCEDYWGPSSVKEKKA
ncbi:SMP-30/gluconolactonase/LRE family protein [Rhodobacteraceae bacterium KMM 6894]|nr:SMP-30/gluconolactonase/LRE family protein [Rhodobacteraceae bacterium KMM 6894]